MRPLSRLESLIQEMVERPAGRLFPKKLHPLELAGALERAMEGGAALLVDRVVAPNRFTLRMHPEDAARFEHVRHALETELVTHLTRFAAERDYRLLGRVSVTLTPDESVRPGDVRATAETREEAPPAPPPAAPGATQKIDPRRFQAAVRAAVPPASLTLLDGSRAVERFTIGKRVFSLGRADDNDAQILDPRTSRHHAQIDFEPPDFYITDLGSTNGTLVNGRPVARRTRLKDGDTVELGGPRLLFRRA
ncbi:MAG TPA: DUF3662 and FHA domain-containing protein [Dehalococcoidia bacterium]